ncbi:hypothetical protein HHK36_021146 [Tetracentron sinense]|uniref:Uncharacterized protein n=1 Tax=Tetracentron sinense TaxID=13715 RepID=A0A834YTC3_TETSI|nr:hypothetical protein HHK36_021146 [Tetracentron sinense]
MGIDKWLLLRPLQRAVNKVRFLLSLNINQWRVAASIVGASRRRLSFNDRPGLRGCIDDTDCDETNYSQGIQRTKSFATDEDINKRADMFIANFYRRLQIERQVSWQHCSSPPPGIGKVPSLPFSLPQR